MRLIKESPQYQIAIFLAIAGEGAAELHETFQFSDDYRRH